MKVELRPAEFSPGSVVFRAGTEMPLCCPIHNSDHHGNAARCGDWCAWFTVSHLHREEDGSYIDVKGATWARCQGSRMQHEIIKPPE